jgi:uncharacterized Zn-binding protein involved in type VI secretion
MGQPAAKQGDQIVATDTHIIMVPSPGGPVPTPVPHPFNGIIQGNLSPNVKIMGRPAATVGSIAMNTPPHIPQGGPFQLPPTNRGQVTLGSNRVLINGQPAARNGDTAMTCNDPVDLPVGKVVAAGTVMIG